MPAQADIQPACILVRGFRDSDRGRESRSPPSLRTVQADLPHTALQSVVLPLVRIDESKLPEREKPSDLRRERASPPLPEWVVNMCQFVRNSVFSPAHVAEATPACLAGWHSRWLVYGPVRSDSSTFLRSLRSIPI